MIQNMKTMHAEDEHDDQLVAEEIALGVHTRAQLRAAEAARATDIAIAADAQSVLPVISEEAERFRMKTMTTTTALLRNWSLTHSSFHSCPTP